MNCIGDWVITQKCYTIDFLNKKRKVNEGEVQQYYIEKSLQPIIQPHEFDVVQAEFARRKGMGLHYSGGGVFSSRLICGGYYGPKVWHSNSKYRRVVWQCNGKFSNEEKCRTPHLMEEDIKARFLAAFNQLLGGKDALLEDCRVMQDHLTNCSAIDAELDELLREIAVVTELTQRCIQENARSAQSQEEYTERYNAMWRGMKRPRPGRMPSRSRKSSRKPGPTSSAGSCSLCMSGRLASRSLTTLYGWRWYRKPRITTMGAGVHLPERDGDRGITE